MQRMFMDHGGLVRPAALLALVAFMFTVVFPAQSIAQDKVRISAGTVVTLKTNTTLSPKSLNVGDVVELTVVNDVVVDGHTVIAAGAKARGEITNAKERGMIGIPAELALSVKTVEAVDGSTISLYGAKVVEGKDKMLMSIGLALICCILFALMKGGEAQIPAGTQIQSEVAGTVEVEV